MKQFFEVLPKHSYQVIPINATVKVIHSQNMTSQRIILWVIENFQTVSYLKHKLAFRLCENKLQMQSFVLKTASFTDFTGKHTRFFLVIHFFGCWLRAYYKKTSFANGKLHKQTHLGRTQFGATKHSFLSIGQLLCFPILPYCGTGHQLKCDVIANCGATQELQMSTVICRRGPALH